MPRTSQAPRTYTPRDDVPPPSADDLAAGVVGPMDVPVDGAIPILRLKSRQYRKKLLYHQIRRARMKREGIKPYVTIEVRRLKRLQRLRSSNGLPVTKQTLLEMTQQLRDMDEEFHVRKNMCRVCKCASCHHLRRWSSTLQSYRCPEKICRISFQSFTELYEHQLDVHGGIDPRAERVVSDTFHQQQGTLVFPPATVYTGQQYMFPSRPPTPWKSMEELDEEAKTLRERLWDYNQYCFAYPLKLFKAGYERVKRIGWKEVERQYYIAMEHYYSAMKYPALSRGFHDGCPSVERGRNWLTSTDREDSRLFNPISLGDKMEVEPEFVLIDTKRDQEIEYIELSNNEDEEDTCTIDKSVSGQKGFKTDGDVDMEAPEDDNEFKAVRERKVFESDSEDDVELKASEGDVAEARKFFEIESDSDDGDEEGKIVKPNDANKDSDSETNASQSEVDEVASDNEDAVKLQGAERRDDIIVSDSDSETIASQSDDDRSVSSNELQVAKHDYDNIVSDSGESEGDEKRQDKHDPHEIVVDSNSDTNSSSEGSGDNDSDVEVIGAVNEATNSASDSESSDEEPQSTSQDDIFNQLE